MVMASSAMDPLVAALVDPNRHIKVSLKAVTAESELLLYITVIENGKAYSHEELVSFDNLDYFMVIHVNGWLARHFKIEIDRILYERLEEVKKLFTKQMLRDHDIIRKVKVN